MNFTTSTKGGVYIFMTDTDATILNSNANNSKLMYATNVSVQIPALYSSCNVRSSSAVFYSLCMFPFLCYDKPEALLRHCY